MTKINKAFLDQRGSAMAMALFAAILLGALSIVIMRARQTSDNIGLRTKADSDIDEAMNRISAAINTPANCNATFYGLNQPGPTALTTIYTCNSGSCRTVGPTGKTILVQNNIANWRMFNSETQARTARIIGMTFRISTNQVVGASTFKPAVAELEVTFEKKIGTAGQTETTGSMKTSQVKRKAYGYVVTHTFNYTTNSATASPTILGCPRNPNSTLVY